MKFLQFLPCVGDRGADAELVVAAFIVPAATLTVRVARLEIAGRAPQVARVQVQGLLLQTRLPPSARAGLGRGADPARLVATVRKLLVLEDRSPGGNGQLLEVLCHTHIGERAVVGSGVETAAVVALASVVAL